MQIRLEKIEQEPFRWERSEPVPEEVLERPEVVSIDDLEWRGSISPAHPGWRLVAQLDYRQTLACSRCLQPLQEKIEQEIELFLIVRPPQPLGGDVELDDTDLGTLALEDEVLETDPILLEQLELNIPMTSLCRDDCAGLCPYCGSDRNDNPDCCQGGEIDPRWKALEDLRKN